MVMKNPAEKKVNVLIICFVCKTVMQSQIFVEVFDLSG